MTPELSAILVLLVKCVLVAAGVALVVQGVLIAYVLLKFRRFR